MLPHSYGFLGVAIYRGFRRLLQVSQSRVDLCSCTADLKISAVDLGSLKSVVDPLSDVRRCFKMSDSRSTADIEISDVLEQRV